MPPPALGDIGPASRTYFSQRLRLHYVDWGNSEAPPMMMIHGTRDHCRNWDWVAEELRSDYHIVAPDLRGHGDSEWVKGGDYSMNHFFHDIAQLIHQQDLAPLTIIAHSMGGGVAIRYASIFPETVKRLVLIEGLGPPPHMIKMWASKPMHERMAEWTKNLRELSGRQPRRYPDFHSAFKRMQEENSFLTEAQARHLTEHGMIQNEDGTYSWKFDNYTRSMTPMSFNAGEMDESLKRITCPVLLFRGTESWASDPEKDGRIKAFKNARLVNVDGAGHWVHHDRFDIFMEETRNFLKETES